MTNSSSDPDSLDTRVVFRVYGGCAALAGLALFLGPHSLGTSPAGSEEAKRALLQLTAFMLLALAGVAAGFGEIEDPRSRHRALGWFTLAHFIALVGVLWVAETHGGLQRDDLSTPILVCLCIVLGNFWQTGDGYRAGATMQLTSLFGGPRPPDGQLRSAYEARIREAASQEERHRLARDLHDSVKQQIYAMQTAAATVQARFDGDAPGAKEALDRLRESGREAMAEMEAMLDSLRSTPLTNAGLVDALKKQGEALQFRTGARVSFEIGALPPEEALAPGAHEAIFRVAQEAFANIGRHARASRVRVALGAEDECVVLRVDDDGAGFAADAQPTGMGLANMRERAAAFGARLGIDGRPGDGTRVTLGVPAGTQARSDLGYYRRRVVAWAGVVLVLGGIVVLLLMRGARYGTVTAVLAANSIIFVRTLVAYYRARQHAEDSWIQSPSHS